MYKLLLVMIRNIFSDSPRMLTHFYPNNIFIKLSKSFFAKNVMKANVETLSFLLEI